MSDPATFLPPYQYEMLWKLSQEPLSASELAQTYPFFAWVKYNRSPIFATSNRLRPLVRMGLLDNDGGIYRVTDLARERFTFDSQS